MTAYGTWAQWKRRRNKRDSEAHFGVTANSIDTQESVDRVFDEWCDVHGMLEDAEGEELTTEQMTKETAHG